MRLSAQILIGKQVSRLCFRQQHRHSHAQAAILGLATCNPEHRLSQEDALNLALSKLKDKVKRSFLENMYPMSEIRNRYTTIPIDYLKYLTSKADNPSLKRPEHLKEKECFYPEDGSFNVPIDQRLARFMEIASPLVVDLASKVIKQSGIDPLEIGKIIIVSSTSLHSPGLDCEVILNLKLSTQMERTLVGFTGCGGSLNGLRLAADFVRHHQDKKALVICPELSSLHANYEDDEVSLVSHAIFGDGCAAMLVGAVGEKTCLPKGAIKLIDPHTALVDGTNEVFTLEMGVNGVRVSLSKEVPRIVKKNLKPFVDTLLTRNNITHKDIDFWGMDTGGCHIGELVQKSLDFTKQDLQDSMEVVRENGLMGGATLMFVLDRILKKHKAMVADGQTGLKRGFLSAFSPGFRIEGLYVEIV